MWRQLAADAKSHESGRDPRDLRDPRDRRSIRAFRGSFSGYERNRLFLNTGPGRPYLECGFGFGVDFDHDGRATVPVDYDGDGDLDLAVLSMQGLRMLQNESPPRQWLRLTLRGTQGEPHALGSVVEVRAGQLRQVDRPRLTAGFHTQTSRELHFGLGAARRAEATVTWPSGKKERFPGLDAGQRYVLTEGGGSSVRRLPTWPRPHRPRRVKGHSRSLSLIDLKGQPQRLGWPGRATVVNFWAPSCEPCQRELPALARLAKSLGDRVDIAAVAVETDSLTRVQAFAREKGIESLVRMADDRVVQSFFGAAGEVVLPTTFVFAPQGRLLRTFYREISEREIRTLLAPYGDAPPLEDFRYLASYYISQRRQDEARELLTRRLDEADGDSYQLTQLAQLYLRLGDVEPARRMLDRALRADRRDAAAWATLAEVRGVSGDLDGAMKAVDKALTISPRLPRALSNKGMVYRERGQYDRALKMFEAVLKVAPNNEKARKNLDETLVERERARGGAPPGPPPKR